MGSVSEFRVGSVLARSIAVLRRNFVVFGTLALLFTSPMLLVSGDGDIDDDTETSMAGDANLEIGEFADGAASILLGAGIVVLIVLALYMLATSTMVHGTFQVLRGRRVGLIECIRRGLPAVPRVIGIAILTTLAMVLVAGLVSLPGILIAMGGVTMLGMLWVVAAILIPGLAIYSALWVAVPVAVVERFGVVTSMRRSAMLTKGYRWRIFGILWVLAMLNGVVESIATMPFDEAAGVAPGSATSIVGYAVTAFFTAWSAVAAAVAYHDLRLVKEGIGVNEIAAVFD